MIDKERIHDIRRRLGFDAALANTNGNIWIFHQNSFSCELLLESDQHLSVHFFHCALPGDSTSQLANPNSGIAGIENR